MGTLFTVSASLIYFLVPIGRGPSTSYCEEYAVYCFGVFEGKIGFEEIYIIRQYCGLCSITVIWCRLTQLD